MSFREARILEVRFSEKTFSVGGNSYYLGVTQMQEPPHVAKIKIKGSQGFTSGLQVANLHLRGIAKGRDPSTPPILFPALLLLSSQRIRICSVSEKNSSRKLAGQRDVARATARAGVGAWPLK
jgi:hypothetical protein